MKQWRRRLRALVRRNAVDRELDEELAFHLDLETEMNLRGGMSPAEARRQAALKFGGAEKFREQVREARWLDWLNGLSLDARLGVRMLLKYPGLTLIGGLGMAIAMAVAAIFDATLGAANAPIPVEGGDRIVALEVWDAEINNQEGRFLYDYGVWGETVRSIDILGAYRTTSRNLIIPGGSTAPVRLAEMTASGFKIIGTPPLLGRPLIEGDEAEGAPPAVVLGYDIWQSRFGAAPDVVGREVRLGNGVHTVVGVMPQGFGFPLGHRLWVPLQLDPSDFAPREGPRIVAFGRLAPGMTIDDAQEELAALGRRTAAAFPATHQHLRPRAIQYGPHLMDDLEGSEIPLARASITVLLLIIAVNVSVLVFARTATRTGEIAVRSALGASRKRIVTQFFAEGLVLATLSALFGLVAAAFVLQRIEALMDGLLAPMGGLPFWLDFHLSPQAALFPVALAAVAAVIVGIVPALRATGSRIESALRALGSTKMQLGRTWSMLIVAQVAFTVAILPATIFFAIDFARYGIADPGFAAEEYLTTGLLVEREVRGEDADAESTSADDMFTARYAAYLNELDQRLEAEPEVLGATFSSAYPADEPTVRFVVEGAAVTGEAADPGRGHGVKYNRVDARFFDTFDLPVLSGRGFEPGDFSTAASPVIVNRAFVRDILGGADALGRRMRFAEGYRAGGVMRVPDGLEQNRWYEIIGVVGDLPANAMEPGAPVARAYRPLEIGSAYALILSIHTRGAPAEFAPHLREVAAAVDPTLQTRELQPLENVIRAMQGGMRLGALGLGLLTGSVLLLSAAGIYALMSFTVTQRRREIGIRRALGAHPRRILAGIFRRAAVQLGIGGGLGLAVAIWMNWLTGGELTGGAGRFVIPAVAAIMLAVGLVATLGPARRGLGIEPMEALREE